MCKNRVIYGLFIGLFCLSVFLLLGSDTDDKKYRKLFGFDLPSGNSRVVFVSNGLLDTPRFEFKLSAEDFEIFSPTPQSIGYGQWKIHKYDNKEFVSVLERFLYGYAEGASVFYTCESDSGRVRRSLVYDPNYQYFISIYYNK